MGGKPATEQFDPRPVHEGKVPESSAQEILGREPHHLPSGPAQEPLDPAKVKDGGHD